MTVYISGGRRGGKTKALEEAAENVRAFSRALGEAGTKAAEAGRGFERLRREIREGRHLEGMSTMGGHSGRIYHAVWEFGAKKDACAKTFCGRGVDSVRNGDDLLESLVRPGNKGGWEKHVTCPDCLETGLVHIASERWDRMLYLRIPGEGIPQMRMSLREGIMGGRLEKVVPKAVGMFRRKRRIR